jgi:RES domain-containing protein
MRLTGTHRLVASRYPTTGLLDEVAAPGDLELMFELDGWSNDRVSGELGILSAIPASEWVIGKPMATVIMAAFCHPRPGGGRFNSAGRGAWYAARSLATAHAEVVFHRTVELSEIGVFETRVQMRLYLANFDAAFFDVRPDTRANRPFHDPASYVESQRLGAKLLEEGSPGVIYRSVRHPGGECVACFRPKLVQRVRVGGHFEYRWTGTSQPSIIHIGA